MVVVSKLEAAAAEVDSGGGVDSTLLESGPAPHRRLVCLAWAPVRRWSGQPSLRLAAARLRAARGELLQQRGEFSLHVDHPMGFGQVRLQARVLLPQPGYFALAWVSWRSAAGAARRSVGTWDG